MGRAWVAIREDEIAAKAMGINTRNVKLLAFAMGASFGGVSGAMFARVPGLRLAGIVLAEESIVVLAMVVLGGIGHIPGVMLGARAAGGVAGSAALRRRARCSNVCSVKIDRRPKSAPVAVRPGDGADHAVPPGRPVAVAEA